MIEIPTRRLSAIRLDGTAYDITHQVGHDGAPTLADLAADPGELIDACQNCHHDAVLPVAPMLARYGPTTPFPEVKGRFRCSACGSRQIDVRPDWSRRSPGQITRHTNRPARSD